MTPWWRVFTPVEWVLVLGIVVCLVLAATVGVHNYQECRAKGFSRLYCGSHR